MQCTERVLAGEVVVRLGKHDLGKDLDALGSREQVLATGGFGRHKVDQSRGVLLQVSIRMKKEMCKERHASPVCCPSLLVEREQI